VKENLIPVDLTQLDSEMEKDSELKNLLTMKGEDLPEQYLNLIDETAPFVIGAKDGPLYFLIEHSLDYELNMTSLFSVSEKGTYEGFIAYQVDGDEVTGITMFPLRLKHEDFTFQDDLKEFIKFFLLPKYNKISWRAKKRNLANGSYRKTINELGGHQFPEFDENYSKLSDETTIRYWIDNPTNRRKQ
jgi:hypothetical protein